MYYCYVLKSIKNGRLYTGYTSDLQRRIREHNDGVGSEYTRKAGPYKLIYYEAYLVKEDALKAEKFFKTGYGREILKGKLEYYLNNK